MQNFQDKVAVVTGAASGLGRELANAGARLGMKLVLADVQTEALESVERELQSQGAQVHAVFCDVRKLTDVQALADAAMSRFERVHLLFNNAGVAGGGLMWENSAEDWEWVLGVNLWGVIHGIRVFVPLMLDAAKKEPAYAGHIVNTASIAGLVNAPNMGIYNVSKHAVVSLSETLYHDLQLIQAPIKTSVLCPYFVRTEICTSDRNRPDELRTDQVLTSSQHAARAISEKAVSSSKVSAAEVAERTFDGIRNGEFYIYSHLQVLDAVQARMEAIIHQRAPSNPYAALPKVRSMLLEKMQSSVVEKG